MLGYFVCDWYMNVDCAGSEKYFNLNDLIGDSMDGVTQNDLMNSVKDIMTFTKPPTQPGKGGSPFSGSTPGDRNSGSTDTNRRTGTGNDRPTNGGPGGSSLNGNVPLRGSANLAQPVAGGGSGHPGYSGSGSRQGTPQSYSGSPYTNNAQTNSPSRLQGGTQNLPQRGANGGTIYVNSLGQLSTDDGSGFDPKHSFILRPDKDSKFDQDPRIPSNSFDILKGIENSYSFGFPDDITAPLRGSADLSEPVDLSLFGSKTGPSGANGNRKQIYTYPSDTNGYQQSSIPPEQQGQLNTKLAAQAPKYPAQQIYGPALSQTGQTQNPAGAQRGPTVSQTQPTNTQGGANYPKTGYPSSQRDPFSQRNQNPNSRLNASQQGARPRTQYPSTQSSLMPQNYPQSNGITSSQRGNGQPSFPQNQNAYRAPQPQSVATNGQRVPSQKYSSPKSPFAQTQRLPSNQLTHGHRTNSPVSSVQNNPSTSYAHIPQKPLPQSYQPAKPNFVQNSQVTPQKLYQQPHGHVPSTSNVPQAGQTFYQNPQPAPRLGNGQSNEEYLKIVLKDKNNVHEDPNQLIELIQRFFIPQHTQTRVVSADVHPSKEQESYSFTYDGHSVASNPRSSYHQHSNNCGHQGY